MQQKVPGVQKASHRDLDRSPEREAMVYGKAGKEELAAAASGAAPGQAAPPGPSDPELQRTMAGEY